jgi:oligopeptidase B
MKMNDPKPPKAKQVAHKLTAHGHERLDPYYWMRDRENPEVIAYLKAENEYLKQSLKHTETLQEELFEEMKNRIKPDDQSVPYRLKDYYYYHRYVKGEEYPIYCRRFQSLEAEEEIILDVNELAKDHPYCQVSGIAISPNQKMMAYGIDTVGRRIYQIRFKNLDSGNHLEDTIEQVTGNVVWAEDDRTVFYSRLDLQTLRSHQIYKHRLGEDASQDVLTYEEKDETFRVMVVKTKSRQYLLIVSDSTLSSEVRFLPANQPDGEFQVLQPREAKHEYSVDHFEDYFYILTNWEAQNFRLMRTPVGLTLKENWEEIIPHRKDVLLEDLEIFRHFLVLQERENGLNHICIKTWSGDDSYYLEYHDPTYAAFTSYNPEFETDELRYNYVSLTTPSSTYAVNMRSREIKLLKQQEILGGFAIENYRSERIFATATDGTRIPLSVVYHQDTARDGNAPLLLYAYGSYGYSMDPYFSPARLSLLNRGFIFVIAHIRGGEEMGRYWYEEGKLLQKKNTFTDFISCAEHLLAIPYTQSDRLFISGGSAGGLLIGAVVNMRPELFKGCIASVPFVDVITTMLDESIPLTTGEYDEWGNPNDKAFYDYILSYSPYDNVRVQDYPHLLVTSGLHDSQVQYWEPTKWVAKLRELKTDSNQLFLHTNMEAGHSGASGRFQPYKEVALEYAFLLNLVGEER